MLTYHNASELKVPFQRVFKNERMGFPGGSVIKNLPVNAGDTGLIPDPGRSHMTPVRRHY